MFPLLGLGIESFIESLKDKTAIAADFADSKSPYRIHSLNVLFVNILFTRYTSEGSN